MRATVRTVWRDAWLDGRRVWRQLAATDIAYKLVAFLALTPLVGLATGLAVALSGGEVLADQDILYFVLTPVGLVVLVGLAGLSLAVVALEQACLMAIGVAASAGRRISFVQAVVFSLRRGGRVLALTLRLTARCLLLAAPFFAALGLVWFTLLDEHDINYYLAARPAELTLALLLAGLALLGLAALLVPRLIGWSLSLPLVLFADVGPRRALAESRARVAGQRPTIATVLVVWGIGASLLSFLPPAIVAAGGRLLAPLSRGHVDLVLGLMLLLVAVWVLLGAIASWLGAASFALLVVALYERFGGGRDEILARLEGTPELGETARPPLSPRRLLGLLAVLALLAAALGLAIAERVKDDDTALIIAHRGAAARAPENTLAAVETALAEGADLVEIDVQETADGEVAVAHDRDLMRVGGAPLQIWSAPWDSLRQIDVGSWFDPAFGDQRLPLLRDVLAACRGRARVVIELKYYGHDERLAERVAETVAAQSMEAEVVAMSLEPPLVARMKALRPGWSVGLLTATSVGDLTTVDADFLAVSTGLANRRFVRRAQARGKAVWVWTVNDPVQMFRMMNFGVDGIITDDPGLARWVRARRAELNTVERLVVGIAFLFGAAAPDPPTELDAGEGGAAGSAREPT